MPADQKATIDSPELPRRHDVKVLPPPTTGQFKNGHKAKSHITTKSEMIRHAMVFERIIFEFLEECNAERKARQPAQGNEDEACESDSIEGAANARKADAGCLMATTKAWDTILERLRVLRGSPLPGSRRPTDPPPKPVKPKNKPPT